MLSPWESYLNVGAIYGYMPVKFKVGDRVRILSTLTCKDFNEIGIDGNIDKYVGKIDIIEYDGGTHYLLENCGMWFPGSMLELVEGEARLYKDLDRYVITLERFDMDGKKYMSGSADICGPEFYSMWDCYIA